MAEEFPVAQTSCQLVDQLVAQGMDKSVIETAVECSHFAEEFSAAAYRGTGRPFYNHLVGVGSIVARETDDPVVIGGAILHGLYELGRLPRWILPPKIDKRREITLARVGPELEEITYTYYNVKNSQLMDPAYNRSPLEDKVLLILLADILENLVERRSALGSGKVVYFDPVTQPEAEEIFLTLAGQLGADWIATAYKATVRKPIAPVLVTKKSHTHYHSKWKFVKFRKQYLPF